MQFICAYRSGSAAWFLGTDYTIGTPNYHTDYNYRGINNDSLNWSGACVCSWTVHLYLKSGTVIVENCKIPTQSEAGMINQWIRNNGFPYWTSTRRDDSMCYIVDPLGYINNSAASALDNGVVPLAKISI
jgi:hypothetical protein